MHQEFSIEPLPLVGAYRIWHKAISDDRGTFKRLSCHASLLESGIDAQPRQVNCSLTSNKGTVRGLHFQKHPSEEVKIVNCFAGELFDVLVDIRPNSPTFLKWYGERISADSHTSLLVPKGFAHGFQALTDNVLMMYLNSTDYSPDLESGLNPSDPKLNIAWPLPITELSNKDAGHPLLDDSLEHVLSSAMQADMLYKSNVDAQ